MADIYGWATGLVDLAVGDIRWSFQPESRLRAAHTNIVYSVWVANAQGDSVNTTFNFEVSSVNVNPYANWAIVPDHGDVRVLNGNVTADGGSRGNLRVDYTYFGHAKHAFSSNLTFVAIEKMQYKLDGAWSDVTDAPIYAAHGTNIEFRVYPKPSDAPWPTNKPVWTGASGSGSQASNAFTQVGTNLVTAECGNTVTGTVVIIKVDIVDPDEDDVHLKGEELIFDGELEPSGLSGVTYAWSVVEGTCDPATATTEDFQTTLKSEGTIKVKLEVTVGGTICEEIRTIEAVLPEVTKLSWKNDHDLLEGATGSSAITEPQWAKTLGGAVTRNEPGAYTRSDYATAELEIEGDLSLTHSTSVQVEGDGNTENFAAQGATFHNWTWSSGELQLQSSPLYASVNFYDTLNVTWYYRVQKLAGGWGDWVEMNQSQHVLYTTLTTPTSPEATPHEVIIDYACEWAADASSAGTVCSDLLSNGFSAHYTWVGNCNVLSSDFIRMLASVGVSGQQHRWRSKYYYPYGTPHIGAMVEQRTISFTPVGGSAGAIEWWWHQWAEADSQQRDPSAAASHSGTWGDYEDYLFTDYRECTNTPYQTQWVPNQSGQSAGCEVYPANCEYLTGPLAGWLGPNR